MGQALSDKDLEQKFEVFLGRMLPRVIRNMNNNIQEAVVVAVNQATRTATVRLVSNGQVLQSVKYTKGLENIAPNDPCMVISPDGFVKNRYVIVSIY